MKRNPANKGNMSDDEQQMATIEGTEKFPFYNLCVPIIISFVSALTKFKPIRLTCT